MPSTYCLKSQPSTAPRTSLAICQIWRCRAARCWVLVIDQFLFLTLRIAIRSEPAWHYNEHSYSNLILLGHLLISEMSSAKECITPALTDAGSRQLLRLFAKDVTLSAVNCMQLLASLYSCAYGKNKRNYKNSRNTKIDKIQLSSCIDTQRRMTLVTYSMR